MRALPTHTLIVSGDVAIAETYATMIEAAQVAAALVAMLDGGAARVSIQRPMGERDTGWTVLVLGRRTAAALASPVPHTIRPVAWRAGVLP
jgi:hypothetical protein